MSAHGNTLVFVYGTLMIGRSNHHLLTASEFLGRAQTVDQNYCMFDLRAFPGVVHRTNLRRGSSPLTETGADNVFGPIGGELYEVTPATLKALDRLESNGTLYKRSEVLVEPFDPHPEDGLVDHVTAWMYEFLPVSRQFPCVPSTWSANDQPLLVWPAR